MMKKILMWVIILTVFTIKSEAQDITPYFTVNQLADATDYLPPPPDTTSVQFAYDVSQYYWGKSIRNTERGLQAIYDSQGVYTVICENFSEAFGMTISPEETPAMYKVVANSLKTTSNATSKCKNYYRRIRPFQMFNEESIITGETLSETSFPSTHSAKGWMLALLLGEINPNKQVALLNKGYEYGQSRVIVGAHWQTDVDAGRMVGSATLSRLHSDSTFMADLESAKAEYNAIINNPLSHPPFPKIAGNIDAAEERYATSDVHWYTIDGKPADDDTQGIVVGSNGKKVLRTDR